MVIRRNKKQREKKQRGHRQRGFSLLELAIVFSIIGVLVAAIWTYAGSMTQTAHIEQAVEDISLVVDSTRTAYAGQAAINSAGPTPVLTQLIAMGAFPNQLVKSATTAITPWGGALNVCAWTVGTNTNCATPASSPISQYLAVEFHSLNYASCITLATRATPKTPIVGLADVYMNGASGLAALGQLPVTPKQAGINCTNTSTNTVDFIYSLRTPIS